MVTIALFIFTVTSSTASHGLGTYVVVLERQFGWSRTVLSGAFSVSRIQMAIFGPISGLLIDRFGPKRLMTIGFIIMATGFFAFSFTSAPWHFYLSFFIISIGLMTGGNLAAITIVNNWFLRHRSLAIAISLLGIHVGGFLIPLLALAFETYGFKTTIIGIGFFLLFAAVPVSRIVRDRPEPYGFEPDGGTRDMPKPNVEASYQVDDFNQAGEFTVKQALNTSAFWLITIVHISSNVVLVTMMVHLLPKLTDMGMSLKMAALVVAVYTAAALPTQFLSGYLADRFPKPPLIFVFLFIQALAVFVLAFAPSHGWAFLFAVLYGVGFGGHVPMLVSIRGDYFGRRAFATITGMTMLPSNIVMIVAPLFAGFIYDVKESYLIAFVTFGIINLIGALLILLVRRPTPPGHPKYSPATETR